MKYGQDVRYYRVVDGKAPGKHLLTDSSTEADQYRETHVIQTRKYWHFEGGGGRWMNGGWQDVSRPSADAVYHCVVCGSPWGTGWTGKGEPTHPECE